MFVAGIKGNGACVSPTVFVRSIPRIETDFEGLYQCVAKDMNTGATHFVSARNAYRKVASQT